MKLRFRVPDSSDILAFEFDGEGEVGLLLYILEDHTKIPANQIKLLSGFPPKPMDLSDPSQKLSATKIRDGDMLILQKGEAQIKRGATDGKYVPPSNDKGIFVRRTVPADNSCCFHTLAYVLEGKSRDKGPELRAKLAEVVLANPQKFTADILGQPTTHYASWLMQKDSWGGAIELMVASFLYQTEIIALDIESSNIMRFGETEGYATRAFIVYTGNHYDALAVTLPINQASEKDDQVLFNPRDERCLNMAKNFVRSECRKK